MKHVPLIELLLRHAYYTDGRCCDFAIVPSDDTLRLLKNHRCLMSIVSDSLRIACPVDDADSLFIPFASDTILRFQLQLLNHELALFTDLTGLSESGAAQTPLFANASATPAAGETEVALQPATSGDGTTYTPGVFANLEIKLPNVASGSAWQPVTYTVSFAARKVYWAYYCITDLTTDISALQIVDASPSGSTNVVVFSSTNRRDLTSDPDPADTTGTRLLTQYAALRCVRMTSDELVVLQQQPRKYLELRQGDERLMGPLPNPSLRQVARDDLLFRIITYRTQPFLTQ